jgi:uncharacterized YigZ family protein
VISTIVTPVQAQIKIQRSEFIAFLHPVADTQQVQDILKEHQILYANATHNCYAYVLGYAQETQYYSDAGEPSGTAGKPILNSLLRNELSGVLAIVTRYYGGIKLGVKGLIDAYTQATQEAIDIAQVHPYIRYVRLWLKTEYGLLEILRHQMQEFGVQELAVEYSDTVRLQLQVPEEHYQGLRDFLTGYMAMGRLDFATEDRS